MKGMVCAIVVIFSVLFAVNISSACDSAERIYSDVARDLSQMECPKLSPEEQRIFADNFQQVWEGRFYSLQDWISAFKRQVGSASSWKVKVHQVDGRDFPFTVKGVAVYLKIFDGKNVMRVIIAPSNNPVRCFN